MAWRKAVSTRLEGIVPGPGLRAGLPFVHCRSARGRPESGGAFAQANHVLPAAFFQVGQVVAGLVISIRQQ